MNMNSASCSWRPQRTLAICSCSRRSSYYVSEPLPMIRLPGLCRNDTDFYHLGPFSKTPLIQALLIQALGCRVVDETVFFPKVPSLRPRMTFAAIHLLRQCHHLHCALPSVHARLSLVDVYSGIANFPVDNAPPQCTPLCVHSRSLLVDVYSFPTQGWIRH